MTLTVMKIPPIDPLFPYWYIEVFAPHEGAISAKECDDAWAALHHEFLELKASVGKKDVGESDNLLREMILSYRSRRGWR